MRVVALVPWRSDGGRRDVLWAWVRERWERLHPEWPVYVGESPDGPFCRSHALNRASKAAGAWDVAVLLDADAIVDPDRLREAVLKADTTGGFVIAYDRYCYLDKPMTDRILDGFTNNWWPGVEWSMTNTCSTVVTVPRRLWDQVGGFDEGFIGWGFEDCAFSVACAAFGGRYRVPGELWHLWHPPSTENRHESLNWQAGLARLNLYAECQEDPAKVGPLLEQLGVKKKRRTRTKTPA